MNTRILDIDPRKLQLLKSNARFMRHETFARLVDNIRSDGKLTQLPFAWRLCDDATEEPILRDGETLYEVLSGNHRVKAAIAADLNTIQVMVTDEYLTEDRRKAIQLSHNAISGEDDPTLLKTLYESIEDVGMKLYTGLDDKTLGLMTDTTAASLTDARLAFESVHMIFLPDELEAVTEVLDQAKKELAASKALWLVKRGDYDRMLDSMERISRAHGIRNTATTLIVMTELLSRHLGELRDGFLDELGEPREGANTVPLSAVLEDEYIPAKLAAKIQKIIQTLISRNQLAPGERWKALEHMVTAYNDSATQGKASGS